MLTHIYAYIKISQNTDSVSLTHGKRSVQYAFVNAQQVSAGRQEPQPAYRTPNGRRQALRARPEVVKITPGLLVIAQKALVRKPVAAFLCIEEENIMHGACNTGSVCGHSLLGPHFSSTKEVRGRGEVVRGQHKK